LKKLLGKKYSDPKFQELKKKWPFVVVQTANDDIEIQIFNGEDKKKFPPEQLVGMLFSYLKHTAEDYLNRIVSNAVIAIPTSFSQMQEQSLKSAASMAGLNIKTIKEPLAAVYAYNLLNNSENEKRLILVFDLGSESLNVTLISLVGKQLKIISNLH
jgi:molecular chaperone DnaK (HSP70)